MRRGRQQQVGGGNWRCALDLRFHPFSRGAADMTPLRQKMIRELELHRKSTRTIEAYVTAVAQLARHYGRSPDTITIEEVRDFLHHLITQRKVAFSTCNQKLAGIRFLYRQVLGQEEFSLRVPAKRSGRLPEPLSRSEIAKLLDATRNTKHRVLLMTAYGGGLRVSELVHLQPHDIHSERMLIRAVDGGHDRPVAVGDLGEVGDGGLQ